jgi:citrate synthase
MWVRFSTAPWLSQRDPMAVLRVGLSLVDSEIPAELIGAAHAIVAAWIRHHRGAATFSNAEIPNDVSAGAWLLHHALHSGNANVDVAHGAALDRYLCTVIDHGMNASTFAARVVASTRASLSASLTAGVAALSGPLHGGAPGPVLDLLDAIEAGGMAVIDDELAAGRRLMGFGHRVYRVRDPRAAVLERTVSALASPSSSSSTSSAPTSSAAARLALARRVEVEAERRLRARHPERALPANVEFFTAVLLEAVGLPREAFAAVFAAGRVAGWCAHVVEQRRVGKLIRPQSVAVAEGYKKI